MTSLAAELVDVSVSYQAQGETVIALEAVNFSCKPGTSTSIVGRSGSGKSTLISVLSLLRQPTSGQVLIDGDDAATLDAASKARLRASRIGIVFQSFHLEPSLTVRDNVMLGWHFQRAGLVRSQAITRVAEDLEILEIAALADRHPNELSGGQRQRVAVARAIFARPSLLVADEPTGNLDESNAGTVAELLLSLPARYGTAVILVTHDQAISRLAEARLELVRGRIHDVVD